MHPATLNNSAAAAAILHAAVAVGCRSNGKKLKTEKEGHEQSHHQKDEWLMCNSNHVVNTFFYSPLAGFAPQPSQPRPA